MIESNRIESNRIESIVASHHAAIHAPLFLTLQPQAISWFGIMHVLTIQNEGKQSTKILDVMQYPPTCRL
jgi:hypothetical protein